MSTTTTSSKRSSTSSSQSSTPASPGFASTILSQWRNDSRTNSKDKDAGDRDYKVSRDFHAGRAILPPQTSINEGKTPRFILHEDGSHEHIIHDVKGRSKSLSMTYHLKEQQMLHLVSKWIKGHRREEEAKTPVDKESIASSSTKQTLSSRYGRCGHVLGSGAFGIVRISHRISKSDCSEQLFAIKQLAQLPNETPKTYHKRITSEYRISSSLSQHPNIVSTLDLLQDDKDVYCQVMEYCPGGDLHTLILTAGELGETEADCLFKQLMQGVVHMHSTGVAHRDLKPENILLTSSGTIKITDFGNAECVVDWMEGEGEGKSSKGICGSAPYIAPEVYIEKEFDARATDVWAAGCVYMAMRTGRNMWREARAGEDATYAKYVEARKGEGGYKVLENLKRSTCRNVIYSMLDPNATRRLTAHQVVCSEWMKRVRCCEVGG